MSETRFTVHPYTAPRSHFTTWWVRDSRGPKWPNGPYSTREQAEAVMRGAAISTNYIEQEKTPMTTPDIAGLCERLEKHTVVEPQGDGADKLYHYPDGARAARIMRTQADTLERQAAEIERLRALVKERYDAHQFRYGDEETPWMIAARAALTGEDA